MNNIEKMYNKMRDVIRFCVEPKSEIPADDEKIKKLCDQIKKVIEGAMGEVFTKPGVIEQITKWRYLNIYGNHLRMIKN